VQVPVTFTDPINARILAIAEDRLHGFQSDPLGEIAHQSGVELPVVIERLRAMLAAGTIRRIRQTLLATNLAQGALVAWQVPDDQLTAAFDYLFQQDPFSGHVVIRTTDAATAGAKYKLWTTLKVPQGFSMENHCRFLAGKVGAEKFILLPAKKLFVLGVGHVRRRGLEPGSRADVLADVTDVNVTPLTDREWRILIALKREFTADELAEPLVGTARRAVREEEPTRRARPARPTIWAVRATEAGVTLDEFCAQAEDFHRRGLIGRFSAFLEHVKPTAGGDRVTRFNALFHWAVPAGRELDAGREVGRHHIMTHAYWREGGPEFHHVNIMGVAHGTDRELLLAHKAAIDRHLAESGITVTYTNVFWGGRSEIKPSEISPFAYRQWCASIGLRDSSTLHM
jgi:hypothetical protein